MIQYSEISLKKYNTFGLDYKADSVVFPESENEIVRYLRKHPLKIPLLIIGGGSNILFTDNFNGTIIKPAMSGVRVEEENDDHVIVSADAGLNWDDLVEWTVDKGFGGLENLSLIPGNVGATPIQNIGAYGVEVKDHIEKVRAISVSDHFVKEFTADECNFSYRNSIFKNKLKGHFLVTRVFFRLNMIPVFKLNYGSIMDELGNIGGISLKNVRQAVINIRRAKLPDPEIIGNAGSFFKNPVVGSDLARKLKTEFPEMPFFSEPTGNIKLAAGWLIEKCGWKGKRIGRVGIHEKQALVITNPENASGKEIFEVSEKVRLSVLEKFGIELEREVEVIGSI